MHRAVFTIFTGFKNHSHDRVLTTNSTFCRLKCSNNQRNSKTKFLIIEFNQWNGRNSKTKMLVFKEKKRGPYVGHFGMAALNIHTTIS